jgi:hypothetical protein
MKVVSVGVSILISACMFIAGSEERKSTITQIAGKSFVEIGQVVNGVFFTDTLHNQWRQRMGAILTLDANPHPLLRATISLEMDSWYSYTKSAGTFDNYKRTFSAYLDYAYGTIVNDQSKKPPFALSMGYYPFKFDAHARNLGEYMFRTGVGSTPYILNFVDYADIRLFGAWLRWAPIDQFTQDIMLTDEDLMPLPPLYDWSLTFLSTYRPIPMLTLGAGLQFTNLISANDSLSSPRDVRNAYLTEGRTSPSDLSDTTPGLHYYSTKGTKLLVHASIDPKAAFESTIFGPEDLVLYGELAVLGIDPVHVYYDSAWQSVPLIERMPLMIGFNLPAFKLLNVVSFEIEIYKMRLPNNLRSLMDEGMPRPATGAGYDPRNYTKDDFKWSIFVKKDIIHGLSCLAQVANDHMRLTRIEGYPEYEDVLRDPKHWWWLFKLIYSFD